MTSWPDLSALELLVAVADHGSLSSGARATGVAQPNASRSIARLERHLGVTLLHRSTAGSTLTASGLLVVDWSRNVIRAARELTDGAASLATDSTESIVVAASQTVAEHLLPSWLAALREAHPEVRIEIHVHNTHDVLDDLLEARCDLGFIEGPRPPRGVNHLVVAHDELVLVVTPGHPWARRRSRVSADELSCTPLVMREPGSGTRVALDEALGTPARPAVELASNAAVRVSVQSGTAPAVLSRLAVSDALAAGSLCEVPTTLRLHRQLRAVWTGPRRMRGAAADLVEIAGRA
ncbi:transcriptional regulator [Flexivirga endophytica]|uniref:Transcriptional regulator n=1 Tax=Flexivirga endophytica TaxID=1849103 RepID=A0A916TFV6_9MICO|nr:LysR family transcriptional regulator [Flexivirga endophytica]GGB40949.1 transcriptional regulator [Flexivirga endophytica]GHB48738.1 transcriptional regulator [Flexivirga endophytica]